MPMKNDDRTLAQRAGRGDQEAFAQLVERYTGLVYSLAMQRVGNHHDAEDVAPIEIGGRKWEGFTATSLGTKICVLYTGDDPAGDQFCANVWLDMSGEGKDVLATDDPALIAILGSVKVN